MVDKRLAVGGVLFFCLTVVAGCTSGDAMSIDEVRKTAVDVGESPISCPIPYDVSKAFPGSRDMQPGEVKILVSKTRTPAADPVSAQEMSGIEAAAGVSIECRYKAGDKSVVVWLWAMPRTGAIVYVTPRVQMWGRFASAKVRDFIEQPPNPGEVKLAPGGTVAVGRLRLQGKGDAVLAVFPDGLATGKDLEEATRTLLSQIKR